MKRMGKDLLPPRVFLSHGRYYIVVAEGKKRRWDPLTRESEGLPALYMALARRAAADVAADRMPALIAAWQAEVMVKHAEKTQVDERARCKVIAESFSAARASDVEAPHIIEFLKPYYDADKARTHNLYRAQLRELMRFAITKGYRTTNPVDAIRTMSEVPRTRYITDSEMRRIKVGACYGDDGKRTQSGRIIAALIDMAYLTGQDISMLLALQWTRDPTDPDAPHVADRGLFFRRAKVKNKTGAAVLIEWTPRLQEVVARLRAIKAERQLKRRAHQRPECAHLFTSRQGTRLTYSGAASAWQRAVRRAGVPEVMFRDLRAKALTDKEARDGMQAARHMGAHSTEAQTSDYVRTKGGHKTRATR